MNCKFNEYLEIWDNDLSLEKNTCSEKDGNNIINVVKCVPNFYTKKIFQIVKFYLNTINKRYLRANQILEIVNYLKFSNSNDLKIIYLFYPLVRDYWNILEIKGHSKVSVIYFNKMIDLYDNENQFLNKEIDINFNLELPIEINSSESFNVEDL